MESQVTEELKGSREASRNYFHMQRKEGKAFQAEYSMSKREKPWTYMENPKYFHLTRAQDW